MIEKLYEAYHEFNVYSKTDCTLEIHYSGCVWLRGLQEEYEWYSFKEATGALIELKNQAIKEGWD